MKWKFSASRSKEGSAGKRLDRMNKTNLMGGGMLGYLYAYGPILKGPVSYCFVLN